MNQGDVMASKLILGEKILIWEYKNKIQYSACSLVKSHTWTLPPNLLLQSFLLALCIPSSFQTNIYILTLCLPTVD